MFGGNSPIVLLASSIWVSGSTSPIVTWDASWRGLLFRYRIAGYNGGTPIGRILMGTVAHAISTTAANNGQSLMEGASAPTTTSVSVPGCPVATTASSIARHGWMWLDGESGSLKEYEVVGSNGNVSVSAARTIFQASGAYSDLGTNLLLNQAQLGVYDLVTSTSLSSQTFTSGTRLDVFGVYL